MTALSAKGSLLCNQEKDCFRLVAVAQFRRLKDSCATKTGPRRFNESIRPVPRGIAPGPRCAVRELARPEAVLPLQGSELPVPFLVPVAAHGKARAVDLHPLDVVHFD
jgi:hypothetical protein